MTNLATQTGFDAEAYLAWEDRLAEKHEYAGGEVFAMGGRGAGMWQCPETCTRHSSNGCAAVPTRRTSPI